MIGQLAAKFWNDQVETIRCLRRMPLWVQIWMAAILIPVNLGGFLFLREPYAIPIIILANTGMLIVGLMIPKFGGTTKLMSAPHVIRRILLIGFLVLILSGGLAASPTYIFYLWLLLVVNAVGLALDSYAVVCWFRGERQVI